MTHPHCDISLCLGLLHPNQSVANPTSAFSAATHCASCSTDKVHRTFCDRVKFSITNSFHFKAEKACDALNSRWMQIWAVEEHVIKKYICLYIYKDCLKPRSEGKSSTLKPLHLHVVLPAALRTIVSHKLCGQKAPRRRKSQVRQVLVQHMVAARDWLWRGWGWAGPALSSAQGHVCLPEAKKHAFQLFT